MKILTLIPTHQEIDNFFQAWYEQGNQTFWGSK
jgi:hypothetical protein